MALKYKVKQVKDGYIACVLVPGPRGPVVVRAGVRFADVARSMEGKEAELSGFFGSIGRAIKRVTKSKALRKAFKTARSVASNPAVTGVLMAVNPPAAIGLQTSLQAISGAEKLLGAAKSGKPGDKKRVMARATIKAAQYAAKKEALQRRTGGYALPVQLPGLQGVPPQVQAAVAKYLSAVLPQRAA